MLRLGNHLLPKRQVTGVELRRRDAGADIYTYMADGVLRRHFDRVEDAQLFLRRFASCLAS